MGVFKKSGRWKRVQENCFKKVGKLRITIMRDDLRNAKRPPDWLLELQTAELGDCDVTSKTA